MEIRYNVILFIMATAYREANGNMINLPVSDQEHNVTKRDLEGYVLGGSPKSMPTAVAIFMQLGDNPIPQPRCSGTILFEDILLSAAHFLIKMELRLMLMLSSFLLEKVTYDII